MSDQTTPGGTDVAGGKPKLTYDYGVLNKEYAVSLARCAPENDGPIYMVNLMKYREVADYEVAGSAESASKTAISGKDADDKYNPASILNQLGASIVYVADVVGNHIGDEDWDRIAIVKYPTRRSFIEMQSRKDFGEKHVHKAAGMLRTTLIGCQPANGIFEQDKNGDGLTMHSMAMVVRRTEDRTSALAQLPNADALVAEGTVLSDGRTWDVVQLVEVEAHENVPQIASMFVNDPVNSVYVMGLHGRWLSHTPKGPQ